MSKNRQMEGVYIPKAEQLRMDTNKKLLGNWINKIEEAKAKGETSCCVSESCCNGVTKYAIQKFIDAGCDIYYRHYIHDGTWLINIHWEDGCLGRIYDKEERRYVDIDEMFIY